jgi:uncharacterized lipoprotein YehR (DUF1307 family)
MKKIIISAILLATLVSCGQKDSNKTNSNNVGSNQKVVKVLKPEEALKESQKSVIESINKLANYTEKGISK